MGAEIGLGHQRRMEAVADALSDVGLKSRLAPLEPPMRAACAVIDSYVVRADDRSAVVAETVVAVDDLERDLAVDLVVDPTPGAAGSIHAAARSVLAGAEHALIGPGLPHHPRPPAEVVRRVLVTAGGGRAGADLGTSIAGELAAALPDVDIQLAVGPWGGQQLPPGVTGVRTSTGLGPAIDEADLVITAAGVTLLETLAMGRPAVGIVIADNQRRSAAGIDSAGAAVIVEPDDAVGAALGLVGDAARRRALSAAAAALIDRKGPARVAAAIARLVTATGPIA